MHQILLQINKPLDPLSKVKIENLINNNANNTTFTAETKTNFAQESKLTAVKKSIKDESNHRHHHNSNVIHPPNIIVLGDFEPLRLAKKKHYIPFQSALKIQKRTGANKPQGRPFNSNLNARFILFTNINDLILNLLNTKQVNVGYFNKAINSINADYEKGLDLSKIQLTKSKISLPKTIDDQFIENYQLKSISFEKFNDNSTYEIHNELCKIFDIKEFSFVKTIRNNKGKLIKFEIMSNITKNELNIDFIKKFITYPRYKSKMKIFLINKKFDENIWFYNDPRMFIWDLENLKIENTKIMVNNDIFN